MSLHGFRCAGVQICMEATLQVNFRCSSSGTVCLGFKDGVTLSLACSWAHSLDRLGSESRVFLLSPQPPGRDFKDDSVPSFLAWALAMALRP